MARQTRPALFDLLRDGLGVARSDADRILEELAEKGELSAEEIRSYEEKIAAALRESRSLLEERVWPSLRAVVGEVAGWRDPRERPGLPRTDPSGED